MKVFYVERPVLLATALPEDRECNARRRRGRVASARTKITRFGQPLRPVGFTLIELLVVMAIIALLISILLPSLASARRQAKQSACLARIKNIAGGSHVYSADDKNGTSIPVHSLLFGQDMSNPTFIGAYEWGGKSGVGKPGRVEGPTDGEYAWITSQYGTKAGVGPATRPLNDVLYPAGFKDNLNPVFDRAGALQDTQLELDLYKCPGDDGPPRGGHCPEWVADGERSSYDFFGNSYAANLHWWGGSEELLGSASPFLLPLARVPNPTRTLLFEENIGRWAWICKRGGEKLSNNSVIDPGPTKVVRGGHGRDWTFNRAFTDGHAATQKVIIEGTEDENGYSYHFRRETVTITTLRLQTFDASGSTIRGDGWQKDVLPAYSSVELPRVHAVSNYHSWTEGCVRLMGE